MQWIIGHRHEPRLVVIYIGYWSVVDSLQWNVKSTSISNFEGANTHLAPSGLCSKLIYHNDMIYEGQISFQSTLVHKGVLVIAQYCTEDSEQVLWIGLID